MGEEIKKGRICVTGATGFLGSWTVKRLLEDGYSVNATIRMDPENKRDISYLTNLPGASERLNIYNADLDNPETFAAAFEGCTGVFHMAHPLDFEEKEPEETKIKRVVDGVRAILQACLDSKTVKRVVYTSSIAAVAFNKNDASIIDESSWTDVEFIRSLKGFGGPYIVTKTLAERAAQEFAVENGLDVVILNPTWVTGPFLCPRIPDTVDISMALIVGDKSHFPMIKDSSLVHVDDVARAHIYLLEYPDAKGRYICSAIEFTIDKLSQFISSRYPEFKMPAPEAGPEVRSKRPSPQAQSGMGPKIFKKILVLLVILFLACYLHLQSSVPHFFPCPLTFTIKRTRSSLFLSSRVQRVCASCNVSRAFSSWKDIQPFKLSGLSSKKLLETGFKYENGLEEMFDGAIESCKQKGLL